MDEAAAQYRIDLTELTAGVNTSKIEILAIRTTHPGVESKARELTAHLDVLVRRVLMNDEDAHGDLTRKEFRVVDVLGHRGSCAMSDLASELNVPLSSATGVVDKLVAKSLVARSRSEEDRRIVLVELTASGREAAHSCSRQRVRFGRTMLSLLDEAEQDELLNLFRKMADASSVER
jgi:DNA-binding MarR family transcriptional regulator